MKTCHFDKPTTLFAYAALTMLQSVLVTRWLQSICVDKYLCVKEK